VKGARIAGVKTWCASATTEARGAMSLCVRSAAAVSAIKNFVVYSSRESDNEFGRNTFNLHLISTKSDYIRRLTASGMNQFPKFSSDGESIIFIKHQDNESALGIIRLNANKEFITPIKVNKIQSIDW
jgi:TolB protein